MKAFSSKLASLSVSFPLILAVSVSVREPDWKPENLWELLRNIFKPCNCNCQVKSTVYKW